MCLGGYLLLVWVSVERRAMVKGLWKAQKLSVFATIPLSLAFHVLLGLCFEIQVVAYYCRQSENTRKLVTKTCKKHQNSHQTLNTFFSNINVWNNLRFLPRTATCSIIIKYSSQIIVLYAACYQKYIQVLPVWDAKGTSTTYIISVSGCTAKDSVWESYKAEPAAIRIRNGSASTYGNGLSWYVKPCCCMHKILFYWGNNEIRHIVDSMKQFGLIYATWMCGYERCNSWLHRRVTNCRYPEATLIEPYRVSKHA